MPTVTQVRFGFVIGDLKFINPAINFWRDAGPAGGDERLAMAQAGYDGIDSEDVMALFSESVVFTGCEAQNMIREAPSTKYPNGRLKATTTAVGSAGPNIVGSTPSGVAGPPQGSIVWSQYSDTPGPRGRGRWYGPPLAEADVNEAGRISAEVADELHDDMQAIAALIAASTDPDHIHVIASRKYDAVPPVTVSVVHDVLRTQRRRALRS